MPTSVVQALQGIFPQGAPTSLMEEAQPPRSLPIGTPEWEPVLGGGGTINPALEQAATYGMWNPRELGLDPFTEEQIRGGREFLAGADPRAASQYIPTPGYAQADIMQALQEAFAEAASRPSVFTGEETQVASISPTADYMRPINPNAPSTGVGGDLLAVPMPDYGPTPPYDEGWSQRRMLGEPVVRSPGEEYVTHSQEIADLKNVEHDYTSDLANWNRSQQSRSDDSDVAEAKYNVMKHLNLIFGARPETIAGSLKPDSSAEGWGRQRMHEYLINIPSESVRDKATAILDNSSTIQDALDNLSGQEQRVKVMDSLTDMANNDTFRTLRDAEVSKEEAYNSEDVVWDQREMRDLAQELINNDRYQDAPTITVENVKEEAKKAFESRTDAREEARKPKKKAAKKPKKKEAKKPKVTKTAVAKALVSKAPPRRFVYAQPPKKKKPVPGYGLPPIRPGGR